MRVHERGSGETRSCGTGACAAAVAAAGDGPGRWRVDVPGGELEVSRDEAGHVSPDRARDDRREGHDRPLSRVPDPADGARSSTRRPR